MYLLLNVIESTVDYNRMLLSIKSQKQAIQSEIRMMERIRYKLSNQLRHFKQFNQLKIIVKLANKHLVSLQAIQTFDIKQIKCLQVEPCLESSERIKNYLIRKGQQLKQLINDAIFLPFATLVLGCLAKISFNVQKIEKKVIVIQRIVKDLQKKSIQQTKSTA